MKKTLLTIALIIALAAPAAAGQAQPPEPPPAKLTDREIALEAQVLQMQMQAMRARQAALVAEYKRRHPDKKAEAVKPVKQPGQEGQ